MEKQICQLTQQQKLYFMKKAMQQANQAFLVGEVPVGCIFIKFNKNQYEIVQKSYNKTNEFHNASFHCQINCIKQLEKTMNRQEISSLVLFVTVEPCIMCTHALNIINIKMVYFGQYNDRFGGCGSVLKHNNFQIQGGILEQESLEILKKFYQRGNQKIPEQFRNKNRKKIKVQQN